MLRRLQRLLGLAAALIALASCATPPPPERPAQPEQSCFVLVRIAQLGDAMLRKVVLEDTGSGDEIHLFFEWQASVLVLEHARAGSYFVRRVDTHYPDFPSALYDRPEALIQLVPGAVNYIGDLTLTEERPDDAIELDLEIDFNPESLREARAEHPEIFEGRNIVVSRSGQPPVPVVEDEPRSP